MGKCTNCGAVLDPSWKFCIACGASVAAASGARAQEAGPEEAMAKEHVAEKSTAQGTSAQDTTEQLPNVPSIPTREPIPSAIRPDEPDDQPLSRPRMDGALIFGIAMAVGGGVLIILVAIALFSPRG